MCERLHDFLIVMPPFASLAGTAGDCAPCYDGSGSSEKENPLVRRSPVLPRFSRAALARVVWPIELALRRGKEQV